ncbi:MAG: hypothetical protein ACU833_05980, partial [Gammaproteobacteria bacterium]
PESLQHQGEIMLALAGHFGRTPLDDPRAEDKVYFDVPVLGIVSYPYGWVVPLCGLAVLLLCGVLALGLNAGELRVGPLIRGTLAFPMLLVVLPMLCQVAWRAVRFAHPGYDLMQQGDTYNSQWYLWAFTMMVVGLFALAQSMLEKRSTPMESAMGAAFWWTVFLVAASIFVPGASFLFLWPLAFALTAFALYFGRAVQGVRRGRTVVLLLGIAPAVLMYAPLVKALFVGLTPRLLGVSMAFLVLPLGLAAPLIAKAVKPCLLPSFTLAASILLLAAGSMTAGFDRNHPRPDHLLYALDGKSGAAYWLSLNEDLDEWTQDYFKERRRGKAADIFGNASGDYWRSPAPALPLPPPVIDVIEDRKENAMRHVKFNVRSERHAPYFLLFSEGAEILGSKVQGRDLTDSPISNWRLKAYGIPGNGLDLELAVKPGRPFKIGVVDFSYRLPETGGPRRPPDTIPQPYGMSDTTAVANDAIFER